MHLEALKMHWQPYKDNWYPLVFDCTRLQSPHEYHYVAPIIYLPIKSNLNA